MPCTKNGEVYEKVKVDLQDEKLNFRGEKQKKNLGVVIQDDITSEKYITMYSEMHIGNIKTAFNNMDKTTSVVASQEAHKETGKNSNNNS